MLDYKKIPSENRDCSNDGSMDGWVPLLSVFCISVFLGIVAYAPTTTTTTTTTTTVRNFMR